MKYEVNHVEKEVKIVKSQYSDGSLRLDLYNSITDEKIIEMTMKVDKPHPENTAYVALNKFGSFIEKYKLGKITNEVEYFNGACGWFTLVKFGDIK